MNPIKVSPKIITKTIRLKLLKLARIAQKNSHSPYSKFKIGSSILTHAGNYFSGCNIENASYGATVCAERVAIWNQISSGDKSLIRAILVISSSKEAWPPCGMCRQVISEFANEDTHIICSNLEGTVQKIYLFSEIFPENFSTHFLK